MSDTCEGQGRGRLSCAEAGAGLTAVGWERARWWHRDLVLASTWTQLRCGLCHSAAFLPDVCVQQDNLAVSPGQLPSSGLPFFLESMLISTPRK